MPRRMGYGSVRRSTGMRARPLGSARGASSKPEAIQTEFARRLAEFKSEFVPLVAALQRPVLGNQPISKTEQRHRFWQEDPAWTPEHEQELLAKGMSPQDVGLLKYPFRELDAKAAGRSDDDHAQVRYVSEMAKLGPPPPEPLAAAAAQIQAQQPPAPALPTVEPLPPPPFTPAPASDVELMPPLPGAAPGPGPVSLLGTAPAPPVGPAPAPEVY